ncbi:hypothetical protein WJX74_005806 [Apatococcus lobatus]|uniref:Snurportin-1 n=1 Tax=Apatococcus lobatus TaxID=904363 RepID=A0AAW1RDZ6_9CHLO
MTPGEDLRRQGPRATKLLGRSAAGSFQQKRRAEALQRQAEARRIRTDHARNLALGEEASGQLQDVGPMQVDHNQASVGSAKQSQARWRRTGSQDRHSKVLRQHYADQLMHPEWLTDVPEELSSSWYAMPRPAGKRCLVIAAEGKTISRQRNGAVLHATFRSSLPGGSQCSHTSRDAFCILDCVWDAVQETYWVMDLMCWGGHALYDCSSEFRMFWLASKLTEEANSSRETNAPPQDADMHHSQAEIIPAEAANGDMEADDISAAPAAGGALDAGAAMEKWMPDTDAASAATGSTTTSSSSSQQPAGSRYPFRPLPAYSASPGGLKEAYAGVVPYERDGLLLLHKEGHYHQGPTPLALLWKDAACSRYVIDTDAKGVIPEHQQVVLEFRMDHTVATGDDPPQVVGKLPSSFVERLGPSLRPGSLLRFSIREGGIILAEGQIVRADLHLEAPVSQWRGRADPSSKIIFQHLARTKPVEFQELLAASVQEASCQDDMMGHKVADA